MFFILGIRKTRIGARAGQSLCSHCGESSIALMAHQNYFHVFWIPLFPLWKEVNSNCLHCKQQLHFKQLSPELKIEALSLRKLVKTPVFTLLVPLLFLGLFLFSLIVHSV
ncbi:MAG: hypothetical protein ACTHY9_13255 [Sphingobacterium sp.]